MGKKPDDAPETEAAPTESTAVGRPSSYKDHYAEEASALCREGATDTELAEYFGVTERTINRWKLGYKDFSEACRTGKDEADERVQRSLYQRALGLEYEKAQPVKLKRINYDENGKKKSEEEYVQIVMVREVIPPDTTAAIFWLKNRRSKEWRDVHKHEHGKAGDFDQVTLEELNDFIEGEVRAMGLIEPPKEEAKPKANGRGGKTKH